MYQANKLYRQSRYVHILSQELPTVRQENKWRRQLVNVQQAHNGRSLWWTKTTSFRTLNYFHCICLEKSVPFSLLCYFCFTSLYITVISQLYVSVCSFWRILSPTPCSGTVWSASGCWWRGWSITSCLSVGPCFRVPAPGPAKPLLGPCLPSGAWMLPRVDKLLSVGLICSLIVHSGHLKRMFKIASVISSVMFKF